MKKITGRLKKLKSVLGETISYYLCLENEEINLSSLLGRDIFINYLEEIYCIQCGRKTAKSFQQGFCFACLRRLQECNLCIVRPEYCKVQEEACPVDDWAHEQCHQSHVVYLANSTGLKVGITREAQIPTRWIDQGACQALPFFYTTNRYQAGIIEVALKSFVADSTNWRRLLLRDAVKIDLVKVRQNLLKEADHALQKAIGLFKANDIHLLETFVVTALSYPILRYPEKIQTLSLEKNSMVKGNLWGVKGQYLILDSGVINIRKYGGYVVEFAVN